MPNQEQKNQLFRQEALERLSSPERLDQLMQVVSPKVWLPVTALGFMLIIGLIWSILGRIPVNVTSQGLLLNPGDVRELQSSSSGQIVTLNIKPGDFVKKGDVIATMDVPELKQRLQHQQERLLDLQIQDKETQELRTQKYQLQRQDLEQRKKNIELALQRESIVPLLRQENLEVLAQNRQSLAKNLRNNQEILPRLRKQSLLALSQNRQRLQQRLEQIKNLLPVLEERIEARRNLLEEQLITGDALLAAEQEYLRNLTELSQLEYQLKELDLQQTNYEQQFLENVNRIDQIKTRIQEIDVQETTSQRQYLDSLNQIDQLNANLEQISTDLARINQQEVEENLQRYNEIENVKRDIALLEKQIEGETKIKSKYDGQVLDLGVAIGQIIAQGTPIGVIQKTTLQGKQPKLTSIAYFADKDGKQIKPGMKVQITPSIVKRERYGGIVGKVTEVSSFAVTSQNIGVVIGNQELAQIISQGLSQTGSVIIQVSAELEFDPDTESGYKWSSSKGPPTKLSPGTTTIVRVQVDSLAPISYVIPLFRSWTGIY